MIVYCHSYRFHLGLGCRSGAYLLYGINSTLIWLFCVLSSILSHCYKTSERGTATSTFIWGASLALRHTAKTLAACNAVWLFLSAIFQFTNLDNTCWCNSNKLSLHSKAYTVITYTEPFLTGIKIAWAGGLVMAFFTAALFLIGSMFCGNVRRRSQRVYRCSGWHQRVATRNLHPILTFCKHAQLTL